MFWFFGFGIFLVFGIWSLDFVSNFGFKVSNFRLVLVRQKGAFMGIKLRWLGWACFEIVLPSGKVLITDPFIDFSPTSPIKSDQVTGADYIALTHTHFDHCTDVGTLVNKFNSRVICAYSAAPRLVDFFGFKWTNLVRVRAGDKVVFNDLQVEARRGEHIYMPIKKEDELNRNYPPPMDRMMPALIHAGLHQMPVRDMEMINYVFQTEDNLRILMFGGVAAEYQRQEVARTYPNIAIFQTGSPALVAEFAALSGAELIIPYHHDTRIDETHTLARELAEQVAARSKAQFLDIEHGKWYNIGVTAAL
jgi:L-ascorbate metabolism protein UlaG (beta-lactamase superfamily)